MIDLTYLRDYFFGEPDHLRELGQALHDMEDNNTDPVVAINKVLPPGVKIDPSVEKEVRSMFRKATHGNPTGRIQVRETLIYFLRKLNDYATKKMIRTLPPDPWKS
jgi:hypothetical protein